MPDTYKQFNTLIYNSESMDFATFKAKLRVYEENEAARAAHSMSKDEILKLTCYQCGKNGHTKSNCRSKPEGNQSSNYKNNFKKKWCQYCRRNNHDTKECFKKPGNKSYNIQDKTVEDDSFIFKVKEDEDCQENGYLIDCGATAHIITDKTKFVTIDKNFNHEGHTIELADCSRQTGLVVAKGDAKIHLYNSKGKLCEVILKDALCIPSFKQNILSVNAMTAKGMKIVFTSNENNIITSNGTQFPVKKRGKLYFVKSVSSDKENANI